MKVRDLFDIVDLSIDVCDDYDERCYIAFDWGMELTEAGIEEFGDALDIEVIPSQGITWTLHCENGKEASACRDLFYALAGYCNASDYDIWFREVEI